MLLSTIQRTIIAFVGTIAFLKAVHWISIGSLPAIILHKASTIWLSLYVVPACIATAIAVLTIASCCRTLFCKSINKPVIHHFVFLFLTISLLYWYSSYSIDKSQKAMDKIIESYTKGNSDSWLGQHSYRSAYTDLFRNQQESLTALNKQQHQKCEAQIQNIRAHLMQYSQMLNKTLPMWNETTTSVGEVIQQSYLKDEQYEWIHNDIFRKGHQQLDKLKLDMPSGKVFDQYKLQKFVVLKKRGESKFSGWMDNRMLMINALKTITIDGGWIVYLFLLFSLLVLFISSNKPKCQSINLCFMSLVFLLAFTGFYFLNMLLSQIQQFEAQEYLPITHGSVLNVFLIHNSSCFHDAVNQQLNQTTRLLSIDELRMNVKRMQVDIQGLGETNKLPANIFNLVDEFNANFSQIFCSNITVVLRRSDLIKPNTVYIEDYKGLPEQCRYKIEQIAIFIVNFYAQSNRVVSILKDIQHSIQKLQRHIVEARYLPLLKSRMACEAWHSFKHQSAGVNQDVMWYSTAIWTSSLLLCLVALFLLSQERGVQQYVAVQSQ